MRLSIEDLKLRTQSWEPKPCRLLMAYVRKSFYDFWPFFNVLFSIISRRSAIAQSYPTVQSSFWESRKRFKGHFADCCWATWCELHTAVCFTCEASDAFNRSVTEFLQIPFNRIVQRFSLESLWRGQAFIPAMNPWMMPNGCRTSNGQGFLRKERSGHVLAMPALRTSEAVSEFELSVKILFT